MKLFTILNMSTALATGLTALPTTASAQDTQAPAEAAQAESNEGLKDIIVTAQRREENLQKAALAITAVDGESLTRAAITDATGLSRVAPSLQVSTIGGSATQFYLRGVGNFTTNTNSDAAVAVAVNGVSIARSSAVQGMFYDLERVEVLKGPQGTLYGRNATGGQINVITRAPDLGEFGGYMSGEYGNFDAIKIEGAVNAPMGDNGAIRVSGMMSNRDGYLSDDTSDESMSAIRVQMASELTDMIKIRIGGDYAHVGGNGPGVTVQGLDRSDRIGSLDPRAQPFIQSTLSFPAGSFLGSRTGMNVYQDNDYFGFFAQADIETSVGTLTVLPAYRRAQIDFLTCTAQCFQSKLKNDQFSFEARLASDNHGPFNYIAGLFYLSERSHERANYNQDFTSFYADFNNLTKSYAGFARLTYDVSDSFRLTAAGRYTIDDKRADISAINARVVCPTLAGGPPFCIGTPPIRPVQLQVPANLFDANGNLIPAQPYGNGALLLAAVARNTPDNRFKKFTYRLGAEFDLGPQSLLYGSFETGYKSGGYFNSIDNPVFQPETIDAWTLGSKNRFLDNRLQLNVELFWWNYKDQQISRFATNSAGGIEFITDNVGKTRIRGAELELVGKVTSTTTLTGLVQYLDTKRKNYTYSTPAAVGAPVTGCAVTPDGAVFNVNCNGLPAINAPKWSLSGGIEQVIELSGNNRILINADGRYKSKSFVGNEQLASQIQKGYFTADLQVRLQFDKPDFYIAGFVNNVTDRNASVFTSFHPAGPATSFDLLAPPRTYGVRVGFNF